MPSSSPHSALLTADNQWTFTVEQLSRTPSGLDGMPLERERESRAKGVHFITQVGIMLKLPQMTLSTAVIYLHRFFMRYSMVDKPGRPGFHYYAIGATALFLATKVEENCRKVKELVIACCRIAQKNPALAVDDQSKEYWRWRDTILHNEDLLLEALCFDLSHEPPYKILFDSLNRLGEQNNKTLRDTGWTFLNDSNTTMLCLLHPSHTIAASALYCSARHHGIAIPDQRGRAWWDVLGVPLRDIRRACNYMASVYENSSLKHSEKMYTWTPEDGDPLIAKTRARGPSNSESPTPSIRSDKDRPLHDRIGSTGGVASQAPEQGRGNSKRQRDENTETGTEQRALVSIDGDSRGLLSEHTKSENISQGEVVKEDRDPKRQKVEDRSRDVSHKHQAESSEKPQQNGVAEPSIERQQEVENDAKPDILKSTSSLPRLPPENGVSEVAREEDLSEEGEVGS